jgi:hypothetical protein
LQFEPNKEWTNWYLREKEINLCYPKLFAERDLVKYSILSWYLPPHTAFELQEVLRNKASKFRFEKLEVYLQSKKLCLLALFLRTDYSLNDIFGNILRNKTWVYFLNILTHKKEKMEVSDFCYLKLTKRPRPKWIERKRGYNDHGSTPSERAKVQRILNRDYGDQVFLEYERKRTEFQLLSKNRVLLLQMKLMEGVD